ncbi:MAG TPA: hypothetical protein VEW03_14525 [Longimicrobiaceae bacterium]|nr:hypothetical protein [Longimicrobiaceae bacterium]
MRALLPRAACLLLALSLTAGCADSVGPEAAPPAVVPAPSEGLLSSLLSVNVLQRLTSLPSYSAAGTIGPGGGTLSIPQAGFTITFPAGAVSAPTAVRVTSFAGKGVAYRFEPHGLRFSRNPVITQQLGLTEVVGKLLLGRSLEGAYFPDDASYTGTTALVSELRPASVDLLRLRMTFDISHFSGYTTSSGRRGYTTSSGDRISTEQPRF